MIVFSVVDLIKIYDICDENVIKTEGGYGWTVFLLNAFRVESESWVVDNDVVWLFSWEEFAIDTFVMEISSRKSKKILRFRYFIFTFVN